MALHVIVVLSVRKMMDTEPDCFTFVLDYGTLTHRDLLTALLVTVKSTALPKSLREMTTHTDHSRTRAGNLRHSIANLAIYNFRNTATMAIYFVSSDRVSLLLKI